MRKIALVAVVAVTLLTGCEWLDALFGPPPIEFPEWITGNWYGSNASSWHGWEFSPDDEVTHSWRYFSSGSDEVLESEFRRGWTVESTDTTYTITSEDEVLVKNMNPPYNTYYDHMWHTFTIYGAGTSTPHLIYDYLGSYSAVTLYH